MAGIRYSIKANRLKETKLMGMELASDAGIVSIGEGDHYALLPVIDSGVEDCPWGRLRFELQLPENCVCYLYIASANEKDRWDEALLQQNGLFEKKKVMQQMRGLRFINKEDVLLYETTGRYLWILFEVIGEGVSIGQIRVEAPGDNFMQTFPEVYREKNSFFHRYLSLYSSIYNDFQEKLDERGELLPIETAPLPLLEIYAKWFGIDVNGGFLGEEALRSLLKEAPELLRRKGTKYCIRRICELLIGETPTIAERSLIARCVRGEEKEQIDHLYGDSTYDVTLLLEHYVEEKKKGQLLHLLSQFKPVRTRLHIVFLEPVGMLDEHSYLDQNAVIFTQQEGSLDMEQTPDGTIILQ